MPGSLAPASFARAAATWVKGLPKAGLDHPLFFLRERVAVRGADGLVDRRLAVGLAGGPADLAEVGVVDVAG